MKKYLLLMILSSLVSGIQAFQIKSLTNNSDQPVYILQYTPQYTGQFTGQRRDIRIENPFYKAEDCVLYVVASQQTISQELLETPSAPDSIALLITKKGIQYFNPQGGIDRSVTVSLDGTLFLGF